MTDDEEPKPDGEPEEQTDRPATAEPPPRSMPTRRDNSEGALGLEMARLFGISPKLMMAPKSAPKPPPEATDDDEGGQSPVGG